MRTIKKKKFSVKMSRVEVHFARWVFLFGGVRWQQVHKKRNDQLLMWWMDCCYGWWQQNRREVITFEGFQIPLYREGT